MPRIRLSLSDLFAIQGEVQEQVEIKQSRQKKKFSKEEYYNQKIELDIKQITDDGLFELDLNEYYFEMEEDEYE
jgi:hypothetical protein